jgi:hypothetical protein
MTRQNPGGRLDASCCEERRLHRDRLDLVTGAGNGVDEDRSPVGPRRLAGLAGHHLQGAAAESRRQQTASPQALASQPAIPSRVQRSATSSKIEAGTLKGSVADTSARWAATSSAVGSLPGSASQPFPSPMKTRA